MPRSTFVRNGKIAFQRPGEGANSPPEAEPPPEAAFRFLFWTTPSVPSSRRMPDQVSPGLVTMTEVPAGKTDKWTDYAPQSPEWPIPAQTKQPLG